MSALGEKIAWLIDHGFVTDLLDMLNRKQTMPTRRRKSTYSFSPVTRNGNSDLDFMIDQGIRTNPEIVNGRIVHAYPEYFAAWKLLGCPDVAVATGTTIL